ncbi:ammonium transporter, partial [Bacteroides cellulosilyticus]
MDKYSKRSIARLWIALAVLMVLCTTTETFAQTSAATDSISATTTAVIATLEETTVESSAPDTVGELVNGLNTVWMLLAAMLVFFMQPGFALVEAGFTRVKNTANILMKNFVDFMFGSLLYWFIGFGLMFGVGGFVGMPHFFNLSFYDGGGLPTEGFLVFQTVFCATAATIVSGAMAERTKFSMYLIYTIFISVLIYPISGHWTWGGGWLMNGEEG